MASSSALDPSADRPDGGHGPVGPGSAAPEIRWCAAVRPLVGWERIAVVAAAGLDHRLPLEGSDAVLRHFGDLQQSLAQGPGADVLSTGVAVVVDDLRLPVTPWTLLMASVTEDFPVRSLAVLPVSASRRRRGDTLCAEQSPAADSQHHPGERQSEQRMLRGSVSGILVVGRDSVQPFTDDQVRLLRTLSDVVASSLEHRAAAGTLFASSTVLTGQQDLAGLVGSSVRAAVDTSAVSSDGGRVPGEEVAVVVGMLRARLGVNEFDAGAWLRAHAFAASATVHDVARAVLAGGVSLDALTDPP